MSKTISREMQRSKLVFDITERSYSEFRQACKSKATLKSYTEYVNRFMRHCGYTSYDELAKTKPNKIRIILIYTLTKKCHEKN